MRRFDVGDAVLVPVVGDAPRQGVIEGVIDDVDEASTELYLVRFPSGRSAWLYASELREAEAAA